MGSSLLQVGERTLGTVSGSKNQLTSLTLFLNTLMLANCSNLYSQRNRIIIAKLSSPGHSTPDLKAGLHLQQPLILFERVLGMTKSEKTTICSNKNSINTEITGLIYIIQLPVVLHKKHNMLHMCKFIHSCALPKIFSIVGLILFRKCIHVHVSIIFGFNSIDNVHKLR